MDHFDMFYNVVSGSPNIEILDDSYIVNPPKTDFGYIQTPKNSLTFLDMGVDGVHYALVKIEGIARDEWPVCQISPMDSDCYSFIAPTFIDYLADGCAIAREEMIKMLSSNEKNKFMNFLKNNFDVFNLLEEERINSLNKKFMKYIVIKDTESNSNLL